MATGHADLVQHYEGFLKDEVGVVSVKRNEYIVGVSELTYSSLLLSTYFRPDLSQTNHSTIITTTLSILTKYTTTNRIKVVLTASPPPLTISCTTLVETKRMAQ